MAASRLSTWGPAHGKAAITPLFEGAHVVFPATPVRLTLDGQAPVSTNANHVVVYRPQRRFRRELCDRRGDRSLFAVLDPAVLEEMLGGADRPRASAGSTPRGSSRCARSRPRRRPTRSRRRSGCSRSCG